MKYEITFVLDDSTTAKSEGYINEKLKIELDGLRTVQKEDNNNE